MSLVTLYNALTGASTVVDAGDGIRQKSWMEEVPRWLKEAVEPSVLKGLGLGRLANYPTWLDGRGLSSNPIGQAPVIPAFNGVEITQVVPQTVTLATGDAAAVAFGDTVLTEPDRTHANFFNTTTDPDDAVAPVGGSAPAFLQTLADGGGVNLAATSGVLTFRVNGTLYTITGLTGAATVVEDVRDAIATAGVPVDMQIEGADTLRIFAPGNGVSQSIEAVAVAGDVATALFTGASQSSQPNVVYRGTNGPLGVIDNTEVPSGSSFKPVRRILPLSLTVTDVARILSDDGAGVLSTTSDLSVGTIDYATGAISLTYATAPAAAAITASYKVLKALDMTRPVRVPSAGMEIALRIL